LKKIAKFEVVSLDEVLRKARPVEEPDPADNLASPVPPSKSSGQAGTAERKGNE